MGLRHSLRSVHHMYVDNSTNSEQYVLIFGMQQQWLNRCIWWARDSALCYVDFFIRYMYINSLMFFFFFLITDL